MNLGVKIRMMPIVREKDGLAMSSRNRYLNPGQRKLAANVYAVLRQTEKAVRTGQKKAHVLIARARKALRSSGISRIDYVEVMHAETLDSLRVVERRAVMAIAVRIGSTRLIDNVFLVR